MFPHEARRTTDAHTCPRTPPCAEPPTPGPPGLPCHTTATRAPTTGTACPWYGPTTWRGPSA
eukprot:15220508-Alexandrium_andersonii.AAC.1